MAEDKFWDGPAGVRKTWKLPLAGPSEPKIFVFTIIQASERLRFFKEGLHPQL